MNRQEAANIDISIVITNYNYSYFLRECIQSCLKQVETTLKHEVIVVDDGSTDNSLDITREIKDEHLTVFSIPNSGIEKASNYGFRNSKGKYIVRVDADDLLDPKYLSIMERFIADDCYDFIYPNYSVIDVFGETSSNVRLPAFDTKEIRSRGDFLATGTLYRAEILFRFGLYETRIKNSGLENYAFILKLLSHGIKGLHIENQLFSYRVHGNNISEANRARIIENGKEIFESLRLGPYVTNEYHPHGLKLK